MNLILITLSVCAIAFAVYVWRSHEAIAERKAEAKLAKWKTKEEKAIREKAFNRFCLDKKLLSEANPNAIVLHCLPAHRGEEISENMLDHPNSVVYQQAENRLHAQKAILADLFGH